MSINKIEFRQDIQFLRGLAVLIVVLFHLQVPFFQNGFLGVDIFFVISGFLMAKLYDKGSILDFYKRRLDRIYPAYAMTLFVTLLIGAFVTIPVDFNQLIEQSIAGSLFVSNVYYWNQTSYFDHQVFMPLLNLWSLAIEVQFYLLIPFLYPFLRRSKWLFFLVFIVSLFSCFVVQTVSPKTSFFQMPFRIWEFLIGAYVAWWSNTKITLSLKYRNYSFLFLAILAFSLFVLKLKPDAENTVFYGHPALPALIITLLTGIVIKYGVDTNILKSFAGRFFVKLGDYSYSIYLVHFPIITMLNYSPFGGTILAVEGYIKLAITMILIVFLSAISYIFFEKKFLISLNTTKIRTFIFITILISTFSLGPLKLSQYSLLERNIFLAWTDRDIIRCGKVFRILNPLDIICNIGDAKSGKNILLIGDSHSDSIKRVFADKAIEYGVSSFFVVDNFPLYNNGPRSGRLIEEAVKLNIKAFVIHYNNAYSNKEFKNELNELIDIAESKGIKVFIIAPVPTYNVHIPQAMFKNFSNNETLSITKKKHLENTQKFQEFVGSYKNSDIMVLDPSEFFCRDEQGCIISTYDLRPYYFDSHHLTLTGSSLLKPLFEKLLSHI